MHKMFIDGQAGTTGLQIHDRLSARADIELLSIPDEHRKKPPLRKTSLANLWTERPRHCPLVQTLWGIFYLSGYPARACQRSNIYGRRH